MKIKISYSDHEVSLITKVLMVIRKQLPDVKVKFTDNDSEYKHVYLSTCKNKKKVL